MADRLVLECTNCDGTGKITFMHSQPCDLCNGQSARDGQCSRCNGSGFINRLKHGTCVICQGVGKREY